MITGRDFIFTGLQPWDLPIGSNARDLATEVARHNRVLYVDTPLAFGEGRGCMRADIERRAAVADGTAEPLRRVAENLWVLDLPFRLLPVNGLPDGPLFDLANRLNNRRTYRYVRRTAGELGFSSPIHFIDNDIYRSFYAREYLAPALSIYYRRDDVLTVDYWARHGRRLEPRLMSDCDLVLCNSAHLAETARRANPNSFDIGQGVDLTLFDKAMKGGDGAVEPADLNGIPHPIAGYLGNITAVRLDPDLIYSLAESCPSLSFVMVGPEDDAFRAHPLHGLPNLYFPGSKSVEEAPSYLRAFDICINPQKVNEATMGNYPRKIDEYLAMGKPVAATLTGGMKMFEDYVFLCRTPDDYRRAFAEILAGRPKAAPEESIRFAHTHTWRASAETMYAIIENLLKDGHS